YHSKADERPALLPLDAATEYNALKEQHPDALVGFEHSVVAVASVFTSFEQAANTVATKIMPITIDKIFFIFNLLIIK
ncbi:hypothetical protein, partial [Eubacterium sp.]